jgi:HK97 family phage major capsid protein
MPEITIEAVKDEIVGLVTQLKDANEKRFEGLYAKSEVDEMLAKMVERVDTLETELKRPAHSGGVLIEEDDMPAKAFAHYMRKGIQDMPIEEVKALATNDDTTGGYLTTPTISTEIQKIINETSPIRQYATVETIGGNAWQQPKVTGNTSATWVGETESRSESTSPTLGMIDIPLREMHTNLYASQTQLDDAIFDVEGWLASEAAEAFALAEATAFVSGNTPKKPEGILVNADVLANYVYSGVADALTADGLTKAIFQLKDPYVPGSAFFMRRATMLACALFKDGEGRDLLNIERSSGNMYIHGFPIVGAADVPAVAAGAYAVIFGNLRMGYKIVDKPTVAVLRDPYTVTPYVRFYTTKRVGGGVVRAEAICPIKIATS